MELSEQELVRRQSLQTMRDLGINPYPADEYVVTGYSTDVKAQFVDEPLPEGSEKITGEWHSGEPIRIAGRLMSRRIMGKASFIEIQDSKGRIQVYVSRDDIQAPTPEGEQPTIVEQQMYNVVFKKLLDIGDIIFQIKNCLAIYNSVFTIRTILSHFPVYVITIRPFIRRAIIVRLFLCLSPGIKANSGREIFSGLHTGLHPRSIPKLVKLKISIS